MEKRQFTIRHLLLTSAAACVAAWICSFTLWQRPGVMPVVLALVVVAGLTGLTATGCWLSLARTVGTDAATGKAWAARAGLLGLAILLPGFPAKVVALVVLAAPICLPANGFAWFIACFFSTLIFWGATFSTGGIR